MGLSSMRETRVGGREVSAWQLRTRSRLMIEQTPALHVPKHRVIPILTLCSPGLLQAPGRSKSSGLSTGLMAQAALVLVVITCIGPM